MAQPTDLFQLLDIQDEPADNGAKQSRTPACAGDLCPKCGEGRLEYDGLLNLSCPSCKYTSGGCFT